MAKKKKVKAKDPRKAEHRGTKVKKKASRTKQQAGTKKSIKKRPAARGTDGKPKTSKPRTSTWFDEQANEPIVERYARRLGPFVEALADGKVDAAELKAQESRLVKLMKQVELQLDDSLHGKVSQLLYELTAYDVMHILHSMEQARPKTVFQG